MHTIINVLGAISRKLYLVHGLKFGLLSIGNPRKQKASYSEAECIKDYILSNWEEISLQHLRGQIHQDTQLIMECNSSSHR